jgi:hypothetical protein
MAKGLFIREARRASISLYNSFAKTCRGYCTYFSILGGNKNCEITIFLQRVKIMFRNVEELVKLAESRKIKIREL